jgi:hypothetical protein
MEPFTALGPVNIPRHSSREALLCPFLLLKGRWKTVGRKERNPVKRDGLKVLGDQNQSSKF